MNGAFGGGYIASGSATEAAAGTYNLGWTIPGGGTYVGETAFAFTPAAVPEPSTMALAGMGGLIGVCIAWGISLLVTQVTGFPMKVPLLGVAIGVVLSTAVGLFFGIYPAQRAAKLDPIVALRAES